MAYFGSGGVVAQTKPVPITGGFTVMVGRLTSGQEDELQAILLSGKSPTTEVVAQEGEKPAQKTTMSLDQRRYRTAVLVRGIRSWDLTDDTGETVPVDEPHVKQLLDDDANAIFLGITRFNEPLTKAQEGK